MKAPPLRMLAPPSFTDLAVRNNCSRLSTAHGPAITTISDPPNRTPLIFTIVSSGFVLRLTLDGMEDPLFTGLLHGFVSIIVCLNY